MTAPVELTVQERIGEAFIVEAAAASTVAPFGLLVYLVVSAVRESSSPIASRSSTITRPRFFNSHVNYYFASLLFADTIQGLGGFMDLKWVSEGVVTDNAFCIAQGALKQVGDVGVALSILAITVHTFLVLFFHWVPPDTALVPIGVLGVSWTFITLLVALGFNLHRNSDYYGVTGLWCWISADFPVQRIALEYGWLWLTAVANIVLYIPLFFALRGNILVEGWKISFQRAPYLPKRIGDQRFHSRMARLMLFYPIVYFITIVPTSITRFMAFAGETVPYQATVFCGLLFSCSGIANVILFTLTRPTLLPRRRSLAVRSTFAVAAADKSFDFASSNHHELSGVRGFVKGDDTAGESSVLETRNAPDISGVHSTLNESEDMDGATAI